MCDSKGVAQETGVMEQFFICLGSDLNRYNKISQNFMELYPKNIACKKG